MGKITRYNGNLLAFGVNATGTERTVFGDTAQSDALDDNLNTDFYRGWGIVGVNENPTKQDFNALGFTLGQLLAYLHQVGVPEWNTIQEYHIGSFTSVAGVLYESKTNANTGNDPTADDGTNWLPVKDNRVTVATITPATDADVTLDRDEYSADILVIETGAWSTNRNIIVPDESRKWDAFSNSVYTATVKTAAGTGIAVAEGTSRPLVCDGVDVVDPLTDKDLPGVFSVGATVSANALTVTLNPCTVDFRSGTLNNGAASRVRIPSTLSLTVSSNSTLGTIANVKARLAVIAINNAGTAELAIVNLAGGNNLDETTLISTTAEGGAGAADSDDVIYSTTARSNVPFRVVGFIDITEATAGTWATDPTTVQGAGGNAITSMQSLGYGQTWQNVKTSRTTGVAYTNETGRPIQVHIRVGSTIGQVWSLTIDGVNIVSYSTSGMDGTFFPVVPPGAQYTLTGGTIINTWAELR